ncbi:DExD/H-box ATP-dependent RNA helicase dhh1 [Bonamia ostreae]|uniref:DExD/H-box ATP-dependent RNA helicase dhh1 n=1 Tax=Bonamia ostreae TaxID=126728 RepID=A0ABV2APV1_9EUKA
MALDGIYVFDEKEKKYKKDLRPNTNDVTKTQKMKFVQFGLKRNLLKGIYSAEYLFPSPIQQEAIPAILSKQNILARAKNGTGKTAAYAIPAIHLVDPHNSAPQVLVIVPSRELALQTSSVFEKLANFCQINVKIFAN